MENLFDLLLILFIIYAFLVPLLKKKKPPAQKIPLPQEPQSREEPTTEKSSQDILREIEKFFGYETQPEPETKVEEKDEEFFPVYDDTILSQSKTETKFEEKLIERHQKAEQKVDKEFLIEAYDYESTIPEIEIEDFDYSKIDDYDYTKPEEEEVKTESQFSIELQQIDDVKKAVVYKEIFDTPLALRMRRIKWQRNIY